MGSGPSKCKSKDNYEVEYESRKSTEEKASAPPPTETLISDRVITGKPAVHCYGCEVKFLPEICKVSSVVVIFMDSGQR